MVNLIIITRLVSMEIDVDSDSVESDSSSGVL